MDIDLRANIETTSELDMVFFAYVVKNDHKFKHVEHIKWYSNVGHEVFDEVPGVVHRYSKYWWRKINLRTTTPYVLEHEIKSNKYHLRVAGADARDCLDLVLKFKAMTPGATNDDESIRVSFTYRNGTYTDSNIRKLKSSPWRDVERNYPGQVHDKLNQLMKLKRPENSGKLILWHGEAGTGKTNAIKALIHEWKSWVEVSYIIDPDMFFGTTSYMMDTIADYGDGDKNKFNLVIVEDSGDLITTHGNKNNSDGFAKLLNLTDGLVGQGLDIIFLITTNEPFDNLHPAVARPGRCLSHIEFSKFSPEDASEWLGQRVNREYSLAEMYERLSNTQIIKEKTPVRMGTYV